MKHPIARHDQQQLAELWRTVSLTYALPLMAEVDSNFTGAANLKSPIGAFPKGIPRYSDT
jgi:hypothetical protein